MTGDPAAVAEVDVDVEADAMGGAEHGAWERIVRRYRLSRSRTSTNAAVEHVAGRLVAAPDDASPCPPEPAVLLDALTLMPRYRSNVDETERLLIQAARDADVSWEEIGVALGYPVPARQSAYKRAKALGIAAATPPTPPRPLRSRRRGKT